MQDTQVNQKFSKSEIISKMREHQAAYTQYAALLKEISLEEEHKINEETQLKRLEVYKSKYKYFVQQDGSSKLIDWHEVETLVKTSINQSNAYVLGFDQHGDEGLVYLTENPTFTPMVEDEIDVPKYTGRVARRVSFQQNAKSKQR